MVLVNFTQSDGSVVTVPADAGASLMEAALVAEVLGIDGECGGAGICGTCHVRVEHEWVERLPAPGQAERETVDALGGDPGQTRLACQIIVTQSLDGLNLEVLGSAS